MTNRAKATYLNALKAATGVLDKMTIEYFDGSYEIMTPVSITWNDATSVNGKLVLSATVDFENTGSAEIDCYKVSILNSADTNPTYEDAVALYAFPSPIALGVGEIIRIQTAEYTID